MKVGIGGVVTFKNGKIDQFINQIDLKHLVLETDSPYLAPIPFRGKRNESSYIVKVIEKLASLYGLIIRKKWFKKQRKTPKPFLELNPFNRIKSKKFSFICQ